MSNKRTPSTPTPDTGGVVGTDGTVQIAPTATTWTSQIADLGPAGRQVVIQVQTPVGFSAYFLSPLEASAIAAQIEKAAGQARSGLILPTNGIVRPTDG